MNESILDEGAVSVIEARAAKATPGPWTLFIGGAITAGQERHCVAKVEFPQLPASMTDGRFMAHAREDIPALCATVKHLRAELADVREELRVADDALENQSQWMSECRAQRDSLQSQLEQLQKENEALRAEVLKSEQHQATLLSSDLVSRSQVIQLCKDKAAEWEANDNAAMDVSGAHPNRVYAAHGLTKAEAAHDLAAELEKL